MSEPTSTTPAAAPAATPTPTPTPPPAPQGDPAVADLGDAGKKALDAERTARKAAEKASADLQAQLTKLSQANETEIQAAQREAKEAKEAVAKAATEALRFRVAAKHGISDEDADLFLTGTDADTLNKQAARLVERTPAGPKPDPTQGGSGAPAASTPEADFANFLNGQLAR